MTRKMKESILMMMFIRVSKSLEMDSITRK